MNILAIETSCDETACAIVKDGLFEVSSALSSSAYLHESTGGIVPEVAARKQVESIIPVINDCLINSGLSFDKDIDAVAVTVGPGLIGSLLVGVSAAKILALAYNKPLIPVNHLIGHIYSNFVGNINYEKIEFPAVVLIVSGGHTDLVLMKGHGIFEFLGGTLDDAAGEAFDKVARLLGLSKYLGGKELSDCAAAYNKDAYSNSIKLPRPLLNSRDYNFSFSGLKTAVMRLVSGGSYSVNELAYEFENAVVDVLTYKTVTAAKNTGAKSILVGGGVSANTRLRDTIFEEGSDINVPVFFPPLKLTGDNAIYIASAAYYNNNSYDLNYVSADPSLSIMGGGSYPELIHTQS